jgi:PAS domain S-box-containing protein
MKASYKIAIIYLLIGVLWITLSDYFTLLIVGSDELAAASEIQTIKGIFYVLSTTLLLFLLVHRYEKKNDILLKNLKELNHNIEIRSDEIKRSWNLFKNLFELSPTPMWIVDWESLKFLNVNEATVRHYGYSKEQFKSMTLYDLRGEKDQRYFRKFVEKERLRDSQNFKGKFKLQKKNGDNIIVDVQVQKIDYFGRNARITIANDITEILDVQQNLRNAYDNILYVEEQERNRIAGELHDGFIQQIVAAKQFASLLKIDPTTENAELMRDNVVEILNDAILETKRMILDLRPKQLKTEGLAGSIDQIIAHCDQNESVKIKAKFSDIDHLELNENVKFNIFRIFQENLNNTIRHSKATDVNLTIDCQHDSIKYDYWDNGIGITDELKQNPNSFLSIKRRLKSIGGKFDICNKNNGGAHFTFIIPLELKQLKIN